MYENSCFWFVVYAECQNQLTINFPLIFQVQQITLQNKGIQTFFTGDTPSLLTKYQFSFHTSQFEIRDIVCYFLIFVKISYIINFKNPYLRCLIRIEKKQKFVFFSIATNNFKKHFMPNILKNKKFRKQFEMKQGCFDFKQPLVNSFFKQAKQF